MTMNKGILERWAQAKDDPNLAAGHVKKAAKSAMGLAGNRAVTMGRGNPVGALFPMAAKPKPIQKSFPAKPPVAVKKPAKKKPSRP